MYAMSAIKRRGDREEHWAETLAPQWELLHDNWEHGSDHLATGKETAIPLAYRNADKGRNPLREPRLADSSNRAPLP